MFTIFTIPKPFDSRQINIIQRNAISSWLKLKPSCDIFLVGDDKGVKEVAQEFNLYYLPEVDKNEFGTPLLNSAFKLIEKKSVNNILVYVNADIILLKNFLNVFKHLPHDNFLLTGRRIDLDVNRLIDFNDPDCENRLKNEIKFNGKLHSLAGMDYFIFRKGKFPDMPNFAVGRIGWDNWMIYRAKNKKIPVIDATGIATVIHQNHSYPSFNEGAKRKNNPEALRNMNALKGIPYFFTIEDASYKLTNKGLKKQWGHHLPFLKRYIKCLLHL